MTAAVFAPPEARVLRLTTRPCAGACGGMGYLEDSCVCDDCEGSGIETVEIVACPVHEDAVARALSGELLGQCHGCASEAARGLTFFSRNTTGPARVVGVTAAGGARQEGL